MKLFVAKDGHEILINEATLVGDIHTHFGVIKKEDAINAVEGKFIKAHKGEKFRVLSAKIPDAMEHLKRGPAIVLLKDAGVIVAKTGIGPGSRVVEAGSGSGALTMFLANLVRPSGKIYSYELRKDHMEIAQSNIQMVGFNEFVEFKNRDVLKITEKELDAVILDLPEPWHCLLKVEKALKYGGYLVCYLPTINQVLELEKALAKTKLQLLEVIDIKEEKWKLGDAARPVTMQMGHTAYLVIIRKK